jgi:hypothetical protein
MWMIRCASRVSLLCAVVGCMPGEQVRVELETRPLAAAEARSRSTAALESGDDEIRVRRTIAVPDGCRTISAAVARAGSRLSLRIIAHPDHARPRCPPEDTYVSYTATIRGLRPGRYDLRVVHTYTSGGRAEVVLEHPIVVLERSVQVR